MTPEHGEAGPRLEAALSDRNNSLNLVRLVLAMLVLVSHAYIYAGYSGELKFAEDSLGGWAVAGFFGISGYLVTRSMVHSPGVGGYLQRRVLRIFPGFWVCLLAIAFVFAPISFFLDRGSLAGYFHWETGPISYVLGNALLLINQTGIAGTLESSITDIWNPSLWTIAYEFGAYVVIMFVVLAVRFLNSTKLLPVIIVCLWIATVALHMILPHVVPGESSDMIGNFFKLIPYFLGGAGLFLFQDRIPLNWMLAVGSLGATLLFTMLEPRWMSQACAPLFTYFLLWIGTIVPSPKFIKNEDLSYGLYIYAFPVTHLLDQVGLSDLVGSFGFIFILTLASMSAALLSWFYVEKPALTLIKRTNRKRAPAILQPTRQ